MKQVNPHLNSLAVSVRGQSTRTPRVMKRYLDNGVSEAINIYKQRARLLTMNLTNNDMLI